MNGPRTSEVWGPYCLLGLEQGYVHEVYPTASALIMAPEGIRPATDDELDLLAAQRYKALCESFAQTWRENEPWIAEVYNEDRGPE